MSKTRDSYGGIQIGLHWLMGLIIIAAWIVGQVMGDMHLSPTKFKVISYHKWAGITVLILAFLRVVCRVGMGAPAEPESLPKWQRIAAGATHHLLYLLMFLIPLTGWLMSSAKGIPVVYFGVLPLPDFIAKDESLAHFFKETHEMLNNGLVVLLLAHVGAALKHHYIDRDDILTRMVPGLKRRT